MPILKKQKVDKSVLDLAYERLNSVFDHFDTVSVSFSGGKDSTVCLNLTLEVARQRNRLPLDVVTWDEEAIPYQTEEYCRIVSKMPDVNFRWYCVPVVHLNACSRQEPYWYPWAEEVKDKWVRPMPPEAITEVDNYNGHIIGGRLSIPFMAPLLYPVEKYGRTACIMGIRADESLTRYRAVSQKTVENYIIHPKEEISLSEAVKGGVDISRFPTRKLSKSGKQKMLSNNVGNFYKVYPIYDWQTADVWTAPQKFGWDYNKAYDVMEKVGMTHSAQRCAPPFGSEPLEGLWTFKECFPEIWDKMCYRVRGANTAARHALTVLYSNRKQPQKPDGMEWEEYIAYWIRKFPLKLQGTMSSRIQTLIKKHYDKTKDPILTKTPHPISGISWEFLLKIAIRGDFKARKLEPYFSKNNVKEWESRKSMYARELADVQQSTN